MLAPLPYALSGQLLNRAWSVNAEHALYRRDGKWYHHLLRFPGALFDPCGYVLFRTSDEYECSPYLRHGAELHVEGGVSSVPGYVRMA